MDAGVLALSSLRLMYINLDAVTGAAAASVISEFQGDIEPYFETVFSRPLQGEHNGGLQGHSFSLKQHRIAVLY